MKVKRNEPCPCGSGKKYKYCCYATDSAKREAARIEEAERENTAADEAAADDGTAPEANQKKRATYRPPKGQKKFHSGGGRGSSSQTRTQRGSQRGN